MLNKPKQAICYYLFSLSNFMAALGGGMILGKGIGTINAPFLQGSSLLAFFVGTVLGLGFLQLTPKKFSQVLARWFSIFGGVVSLILFSIFIFYSSNGKISGQVAVLFFVLLSVRFGFWFYSRVLRASAAAGQKQRIAWVELGYYSGIIAGLVFWIFLGINLGMAVALLLDAFLQLSAGCLDLYVYRQQSSSEPQKEKIAVSKKLQPVSSDQKKWGWRLAMAVMLLTIGVQVIIFTLAHHAPGQLSSYMLATFYLGAAVSAFFFKRWSMELRWNVKISKNHGHAAILFGREESQKQASFAFGSILTALSVVAVLAGVHYRNWSNTDLLFGFGEYILLFFIFISTFLYGTLELAIIDRIGLEEKDSSNNQGMVLRTYGLMSIAALISLWLLEVTQSEFFGMCLTLMSCFFLTILFVRKRRLQVA